MLEQRVSDKRPNPFHQAGANVAGDRDVGRWSVQNHRDTKRDAVVIGLLQPCCSEVPTWQLLSPTGHVLAGNAHPVHHHF